MENPELRCMSRIALLWVVAALGCTSGLTSTQTAARKPYDWEAKLLHPEISSIRLSPDCAAVFIRLDRSELLYLRESPGAPFTSRVQVDLGRKRWEIRDTLADAMPQNWDAVWRLAVNDVDSTVQRGDAVSAPYIVRDVARNAEVAGEWSLPASESTLNCFDAAGWALGGRDVAVGDTVYVQGPGGLAWVWLQAIPVPGLPSPPFTAFSDPHSDLKPAVIDTLQADAAGRFAFVVPPGTSVLRSVAFGLELTVHGRREDFPFARSVPYLIETARYVTSRSEYERMVASDDPKGALDAFWLDCGNDKDRGANLISTYYGRVEEANRYFSGLQEGWRTDRGMVHIVFGVPNKVRQSGRSEWWIYGEEGNANTLTFSFRHAPTELDPNRYVLDRSIQFRPAWDRMVTSWRNGRVQGD